MPLLQNIVAGFRSLFDKKHVEAELDEELRGFLEMAAEEKMKQGVSRKDALRTVRLERGTVEVSKETVGDARWESYLESFWRDLGFAFRSIRKSPGFAAVVVTTLALGIGANTAMFTLVNAVMLKRLPVPQPKELYRLGDNNNCCVMVGTQNEGSFVLYSYALYQDLRDHTPEFSELAGFASYVSDLSVRHGDSAAEPYKGEYVSGNYFAMFRIAPFAGRLLASFDDSPTGCHVAVLNYRTWQRRFGRDRKVIGSAITINGGSYTIVGVAAPQFYGDTLRGDTPDFWLPLNAEPEKWQLESPEAEWLYLIGRLRPGSAPEQVQARLTVELHQWLGSHREVIAQREWNEIPQQHIRLTSAVRGIEQLQTDYALGLRLLITLSAFLLLIACANIANLLLARGSASRVQTAVRLALGSPLSRLIRQMLTESVLLALAGGAAGLFVAYIGSRAILALAFRGASYIPIDGNPSLSLLSFALVLSLGAGLIFGIAPAWLASRSSPADPLRGAGRSTDARMSLLQRLLVIAQIALSIVLLIGAGLVAQTLRNLEGQHFGFVTEGRLIASLVNPSLAGYKEEQLASLYQRLQESLAQIPGVVSASISTYSPLEGSNWNELVYIQGKPPDYSGTAPSWLRVGPHYFETVGTRLLQGRAIDDRDTPGAPRVAVINETFARKYFPSENPIGRRFGKGDATHDDDFEIVGIVEDAKYQDARGPAYATFFFPLLQTPPGVPLQGWVSAAELHVIGRPENLEPAVREAIAYVDPNLTVLRLVSFDEQVARNFNQERLIARLAELFGGLALILACVGLYGVTAYAVARRTNEIAIRVALGANRSNVLRLVLRSVLVQLGLGVGIGVPLALAGGRLLAAQLYGVKSYDPLVLGVALTALVCSAVVAALIPARRAALLDPLAALRYE
jgi:predicted permease